MMSTKDMIKAIAAQIRDNPAATIRLYRKQLGLTQEELAEAIGSAQITIGYHERAVSKPSTIFVKTYATFFANKIVDTQKE